MLREPPGENDPMRQRSRAWIRDVWLGAVSAGLATFIAAPVHAAQPPAHETVPDARSFIDIPYAQVDGETLLLDLHLPAGPGRPPLVVYLHGGAWRQGDKSEVPDFLVERGFAVAAPNFRSSDVARFPANVHDIKAGIRFLRANADRYGYRADRIAVTGSSSGGHLAALVGVTNGHPELEGTIGEHLDQSSSVQAFIMWVGASNLSTILSQSTPEGLAIRIPALRSLLGAMPDEVPGLARLASPVEHVDAEDPPALILHGDQDRTIPVNQALELEAAYRRAGRVAELVIINGAGHVAQPFFSGPATDRAVEFLHRTIGR
jgi:acetyl esterase/lipase